MDNLINNNTEKYNNNFYTSLDENEIKNIRKKYKIIDVELLM